MFRVANRTGLAPAEPCWRSEEADEACAGRNILRHAHHWLIPAQPLHLPGAQARLCPLSGRRPLPLQGQDESRLTGAPPDPEEGPLPFSTDASRLPRFDVIGLGNAIVDVYRPRRRRLPRPARHRQGGMTLIDAHRARCWRTRSPTTIVPGGSAANTIARHRLAGRRGAFIGASTPTGWARASRHGSASFRHAAATDAPTATPSFW